MTNQNADEIPPIEHIVRNLQKKYDCHTMILYGSRARGLGSQKSDFDILGISAIHSKVIRGYEYIGSEIVDYFIYPESLIYDAENILIRLKDGVILFEKNSQGSKLIDKATELLNAPPKRHEEWNNDAAILYLESLLERATNQDLVGKYSKTNLLFELLPFYFHLRNLWYLGPRQGYEWIKANDNQTYKAFEQAFSENSTLEDMRILLKAVSNF